MTIDTAMYRGYSIRYTTSENQGIPTIQVEAAYTGVPHPVLPDTIFRTLQSSRQNPLASIKEAIDAKYKAVDLYNELPPDEQKDWNQDLAIMTLVLHEHISELVLRSTLEVGSRLSHIDPPVRRVLIARSFMVDWAMFYFASLGMEHDGAVACLRALFEKGEEHGHPHVNLLTNTNRASE